ncbi:MAG TPA: hypothetical protein PK992_07605 [Planctomycetaceae bacterium]|nr:hypothetical protein [Planctomycetaceae bacterium]
MAIGIDPKVDFPFKVVFGSPEHTRVTIRSVPHWKSGYTSCGMPNIWKLRN